MSRLHTTLVRHRDARARLRDRRALQRALALAPTQESAHELSTLAARR